MNSVPSQSSHDPNGIWSYETPKQSVIHGKIIWLFSLTWLIVLKLGAMIFVLDNLSTGCSSLCTKIWIAYSLWLIMQDENNFRYMYTIVCAVYQMFLPNMGKDAQYLQRRQYFNFWHVWGLVNDWKNYLIQLIVKLPPKAMLFSCKYLFQSYSKPHQLMIPNIYMPFYKNRLQIL